MLDKYNRRINYMRISVTDRCNLRCVYCMPAEGIKLIPHEKILSFDEIYEVAKVAVSMGVDKIRITGGEPLVRKNIVELVRMIASLDGVKDLGMTTNGIYLPKYAQQLAEEYGVSASDLQIYNSLGASSVNIPAGRWIIIPVSE